MRNQKPWLAAYSWLLWVVLISTNALAEGMTFEIHGASGGVYSGTYPQPPPNGVPLSGGRNYIGNVNKDYYEGCVTWSASSNPCNLLSDRGDSRIHDEAHVQADSDVQRFSQKLQADLDLVQKGIDSLKSGRPPTDGVLGDAYMSLQGKRDQAKQSLVDAFNRQSQNRRNYDSSLGQDAHSATVGSGAVYNQNPPKDFSSAVSSETGNFASAAASVTDLPVLDVESAVPGRDQGSNNPGAISAALVAEANKNWRMETSQRPTACWPAHWCLTPIVAMGQRLLSTSPCN